MPTDLRLTAVAAVVSLALVAAPPALAQTSAQDGYSAPAGSVQQQLGHSSDRERVKAVRSTASGSLPFTGLDIALVFAASGVLLAMGTSIRRLTRPRA